MIASRRAGAGLVVLGSVLLGCAASAGAGGPPPSAPPGGAVITAQGIAFDRTELALPAGRPFPLLLENRDGPPHNVTIYDDLDAPLFVGDVFGGPGSRIYEVPALPSGTHKFRCDVHPEMSGTVTAR
jgi:plastocyanin